MNGKATILGVLAAVAAGLPAAPARARDACLVGSWSPVGNGAAEWVQRQAPGMKMMVTQQVATLRLGADGHYSLQSQVRAEAGNEGRSARSDGTFSARGSWSSADGKLTLAPTASTTDGKVELGAGNGPTTGFALPKSGAQATIHEYACKGDVLETRMPIPGVADPIVQRYRRQ
ncbi:copper resistance protein NlpE [Luteimonas viscosa]|uniref:Copper resistance protein NlpE n=1 Tax=Luteimonas viscosa TaxID=1132694 RepID=A0A5D4XUN8_9GAMM|nr:copper resistance protein NlpE [Luteimonas viscosa]TYT26520.1 copper resistance protein NlpE [Luteimonas viscosa]